MTKIKRFGILKMSAFIGLYGALVGLILAIIMFIDMSGLTSFLGRKKPLDINWIVVLLFPLFSGIFGFISALILTPVMNLVLKIIKGLDLDLEIQEEQSPQTYYQPTYPPNPQPLQSPTPQPTAPPPLSPEDMEIPKLP